MSKYEVVEKFVSINGEGTKAGQLAVFIRFKVVILIVNIVIPNGLMSKKHFLKQ